MPDANTTAPPPHPGCLLCGEENPSGLKLRFTPDGNGGVEAVLRGRKTWQGYPGVLHGGVIASLLDAAMTNCLFQQGIQAVTGELTIRYLRPVPCCAELRLRAGVTAAKPPLFLMESQLLVAGCPAARATAKFMRRKGTTA